MFIRIFTQMSHFVGLLAGLVLLRNLRDAKLQKITNDNFHNVYRMTHLYIYDIYIYFSN
jgi:hypothetical protein